VDWGDGSPSGHLDLVGPVAPGDINAGLAHTYTEAGTYTWRSSGSKVMLIAISPTEGNLPCTVPIAATGTIVVSAPQGGGAPARPDTASGPGSPGPAVTAPATVTTVAAGRIDLASDDGGGGGFSGLAALLLGGLGLAAVAGFLLRRRSGPLPAGPSGEAAALTPQSRPLARAKAVVKGGAEYIQDFHAEVSETKAAHDAARAKRREELVQHYLPTVGQNREMAEVLADNDLAQYGSNAAMVPDVAMDAGVNAPTRGIRQAWSDLTRWWNSQHPPQR
jgi:hypothetical protein